MSIAVRVALLVASWIATFCLGWTCCTAWLTRRARRSMPNIGASYRRLTPETRARMQRTGGGAR